MGSRTAITEKSRFWMISEEIMWFVAIAVGITGLWFASDTSNKRRATLGKLLMGVAGVLESYNATLYTVYDLVSGMHNLSPGALSWWLYWSFNPLWSISALVAGIFCLHEVFTTTSDSFGHVEATKPHRT